MRLKEIIQEYLTKHGYDGLYNAECECACENDDLFPCDGNISNCYPGYYIPKDDPEYDSYYDYMIGPHKVK